VKIVGKVQANEASVRAATQGLLGLLDYAIAEAAELDRPPLVFLLKLARLALLEGEDATFPDIDVLPMHDDN
jgi:hypothetical protein